MRTTTTHLRASGARRHRLVVAALLAGTLGLTAGCAKESGSASGASGGAGAPKIGVIVAETGPLAGSGRSFYYGAQIAAKQINEQDLVPGQKVELVSKEGSEDPAKTAGVAAQLAADKSVVAMACCILSPVAGAVIPVAKAQKLPVLLWGATQLGLAEPPYVLRTTTMPQPANEVVARDVAKATGVKSVAYSVMTDNAGIVSQGEAFKKGLDEAGVQDLGQVGTLAKQTDFTSAAASLMQKKPDAIVVTATSSEAVGMIAALHDKGYAGQIITGETVLGDGVFKSQPDALDKVPFPVYYLADEANERGKKFAADYQAAHGSNPDDFAAQGFNAIYTIAQGLKAAGANPTRESLTTALNGLTSLDDTIYGNVTFSGGQMDASSSVKIVSYTKPDGAVATWSAP